ncbi:ATP-binding protein [Dissulfurispira thermophila]|uniref:ATP-binding protein n=4 Tax=root TaxID=1 RepID=A0A7G1H204_9BACT|nr:IS21-like element helper ATPase IstB [Dissulfurispira thermophila]BCB95342.1 ATP-binding protein [Dissulfurispira thermophila]BCB95781.1 ATP-binding protein [Dissulfurispira thermophila]BCB96120.1 ATP-binding protein [Dissulfurispira thermophila]BCB96131.1 ATP-binding protein [Dissulfurispira thermophila]BCB97217.1 ATP-binding protein [Dissulfurispira thermophila]
MTELNRQIESHMRSLKLKGMITAYRDLSERASKSNLRYEEYLALLLEAEVKRKTESSIKAKMAKSRLPYIKTIEEFDFSFQPGLRDKEVIKLSSLEFIAQKANVIFLGPPGVGKTHLSVGLAIKACTARLRVLFMTAQGLIEDLMLSKRQGNLVERLLFYSRLHLLIIDELGYMPITREQANLLFQLISMRYEKGSIILTSNYNFDEWGKVFEDPVVASAIIDRVVHHASIFYISGESYRLKNKLKKAN